MGLSKECHSLRNSSYKITHKATSIIPLPNSSSHKSRAKQRLSQLSKSYLLSKVAELHSYSTRSSSPLTQLKIKKGVEVSYNNSRDCVITFLFTQPKIISLDFFKKPNLYLASTTAAKPMTA